MLNPILISLQAIIGLILIFDGIGSIILYWHQTPIEHLVRILRAFLGADRNSHSDPNQQRINRFIYFKYAP